MILVTMTINGTDHRISTEQLALEHAWDAKIVSCGPVRYRIAKDYGGYAAPDFGKVILIPDLFGGADWPPPASCAMTIEYTETTEAAADIIFNGTAHLVDIDRTSVTYDLYGPEYDVEIEADTLNATLNSVFATYCGSSYLDLTLDTTKARATSPAVSYSFSSDAQCLDLLSDVAAFYSHCFYIKAGTLYLIDMLLDNGTSALTEFDFLPVKYTMSPPYSLFKAGDDTVAGSHAYGKELSVSPVCHGTSANVETALGDIKTIIERPRVTMQKPIETSALPAIGQKLSWTDESLNNDVIASVWVRELNFDFVAEFVTIEGDGAVA